MKNENDLRNYISTISKNKLEKKQINQVLIESQIQKGNKVLVVETSVLFIDIRGSSKLTESIKITNMTKVYKIFGAIASMAVSENDGMIFQFSGDGFMAAFNSSSNANFRLNAYNSVIRFKELLDTVYKPVVNQEWHFDCGYSICTGHIFMHRLKTKPFKLKSIGIFPGHATNMSSKLCELAKENELLVDEKTYEHLIKYNLIFKEKALDNIGLEVYSCELEI